MRAVVLGAGHKVVVGDVPKPSLREATDVVVQVTLAAICGTDIAIKQGSIDEIGPGAVLGHEYVGVIAETGSDVRHFRVGDRVASPPALSCGSCFACRTAVLQNCVDTSMYGGGPSWSPMGLDGVQTEFVRVPYADFNLTKIPDAVPDEQAILVVDMFNTGFHAAHEAKINAGDFVAVSGCGPVGLCAVIAAGLYGPSRVFAIDLFSNRLEQAEKYGATPIDIRKGDPVEQILTMTGGEGMDVVLEASGSSTALLCATRMIKKYGTVSCVGLFHQPAELPVQELIYKGIKVFMSLGNVVHLPRLLKLVEHGRVDLAAIGTHTFPLEHAEEAYDLFENHKDRCLKVFLKI